MAFRHGKAAAFTLNSVALGSFMNSMDTSWDLDIADTTTFGATWKGGLPGIPGGTIEIAGFYDPTASTGPADTLWTLLAAGNPVTGLVYPGGNVAGQRLWTITTGCYVTSYSESSPVSGIVSWSASIMVVVAPVPTVVGS